MQDQEINFGGEKKLKQVIHEAYDNFHPKAITVFSTCPVGLIGDDVHSVCRELKAKLGINIFGFSCEGYKGVSQSAGHHIANNGIFTHVVGLDDTVSDDPYKINLMGVSYGTRAAQVYYRLFPDQVRSIVLDGVVPQTLGLGTEHAAKLDQAVYRVLAACEADTDCATHFPDTAGKLRDLAVRQGEIQARYLPLLVYSIALGFAFLHAMLLRQRDAITVGNIIAYMGLWGALQFPTFISIFTFTLVELGVAGGKRILDLIRAETELDENTQGVSQPMRGEIVFDHVTFGYDDKPVLRDVSFHAQPGETIAIVGQTGSGKTTLTRLINRIYDANQGGVSIDGGQVRVHRVVCAVDCGLVVNPDSIQAQMESGIVYGLSAALYGRISIENGAAAEGNFDRYPILRMREMPRVETHIIAEGDAIGGIGEVGLPCIAPAVCNALFALTGKPVRSLPIGDRYLS